MDKKKLVLIVVGVCALLWCIGKYSESKQNQEVNAEQNQIAEEQPPVLDTFINAGYFNTNQNGSSIGSVNERTILKDILMNTPIQLVTINYTLKNKPPYEDVTMQLIYDEIHQHLKLIYTKNNVIEEYSEVCRECLIDFLDAKEESFYSLSKFCKDSKYDFNNREMKIHAVGEKPTQNEVNGSVNIVKDYISKIAKNSSSIKYVEWSKVTDAGEYWVVRCKYQGENSLGNIVTENMWFYIQNNQVVKVKSIEN